MNPFHALDNESTAGGRIVNVEPSTKEYPWVVYVQVMRRKEKTKEIVPDRCSGSIISKNM